MALFWSPGKPSISNIKCPRNFDFAKSANLISAIPISSKSQNSIPTVPNFLNSIFVSPYSSISSSPGSSVETDESPSKIIFVKDVSFHQILYSRMLTTPGLTPASAAMKLCSSQPLDGSQLINCGKSMSVRTWMPNMLLNRYAKSGKGSCDVNDSEVEYFELEPNHFIDAGLPKSTSEGNLNKAFSEFGEVSRVKIITDKKTRKSLGFAYVWFSSEEYAQLAVKEMNGKFFEGKFILVTIAKPGSCKPQEETTTPLKF